MLCFGVLFKKNIRKRYDSIVVDPLGTIDLDYGFVLENGEYFAMFQACNNGGVERISNKIFKLMV